MVDVKYLLSRDSSYKQYSEIKKYSKLNCRLCKMDHFFEIIDEDINNKFKLCKFSGHCRWIEASLKIATDNVTAYLAKIDYY